jgi:polysaccharide biosynthesis/export protein
MRIAHMSAAARTFTAAVVTAVLLALVPAAFAQSAASYVIGPQDVLTINVFDQADLGGKYTVEADGTFSFPLVGRVHAAGMTLRGFEGELKKKLADGYFRNPQVTVAIETYRSQRVFVMGEVRQPGPVPLTGGMTLIEALARAGSTLPTSSGEVAIVRAAQGGKGPVVPDQESGTEVFRASIRDLEGGTLSQNIELRDGDTIFVPRAESLYVFGQVKNPGAYALVQRDTTILQALSLAGGVTENGAMNRVKVVRIIDGGKREIKVKLTDIVRAGDTIIVPERYF